MSTEVIATLSVGIPTALIAVLAYTLSRSENVESRQRRLIADLLEPVVDRLEAIEADIQLHPAERRQLIEDLLLPLRQRLDQIDRDLYDLRRHGSIPGTNQG